MATQTHPYPVTVQWTGSRDGHGQITAETSGTTVPIAVPTEFGGAGGATNPEELLTSAIAGCYSITFGIVAGARRLPFVSLTTEAVGEVDQPSAVSFTYARIKIRPTITLASDATPEQVKLAEEVAHKTDTYCIVTNAVRGKVEVIIEPTVLTA